ncbi:hypothetical protein [Komagataeibacter medellinensis]|uniref:hypothetical protein n=1 Tax=Komagataeibacter medellinensis TaxID=1177712 RepID=UPI001296F7F8|nr:hypothetical protein [Komagataeibacter medellinensis]
MIFLAAYLASLCAMHSCCRVITTGGPPRHATSGLRDVAQLPAYCMQSLATLPNAMVCNG